MTASSQVVLIVAEENALCAVISPSGIEQEAVLHGADAVCELLSAYKDSHITLLLHCTDCLYKAVPGRIHNWRTIRLLSEALFNKAEHSYNMVATRLLPKESEFLGANLSSMQEAVVKHAEREVVGGLSAHLLAQVVLQCFLRAIGADAAEERHETYRIFVFHSDLLGVCCIAAHGHKLLSVSADELPQDQVTEEIVSALLSAAQSAKHALNAEVGLDADGELEVHTIFFVAEELFYSMRRAMGEDQDVQSYPELVRALPECAAQEGGEFSIEQIMALCVTARCDAASLLRTEYRKQEYARRTLAATSIFMAFLFIIFTTLDVALLPKLSHDRKALRVMEAELRMYNDNPSAIEAIAALYASIDEYKPVYSKIVSDMQNHPVRLTTSLMRAVQGESYHVRGLRWHRLRPDSSAVAGEFHMHLCAHGQSGTAEIFAQYQDIVAAWAAHLPGHTIDVTNVRYTTMAEDETCANLTIQALPKKEGR